MPSYEKNLVLVLSDLKRRRDKLAHQLDDLDTSIAVVEEFHLIAEEQKPGPDPEVLNLEGSWENCLARAVNTPKPKGGWPA